MKTAADHQQAHNVLASALALLASQVSFRLVNFALNLLIARHLSPEAYGLSTVRFHLVITTIMMLSREGFRRGCQRLKPKESHQQRGLAAVDPWRVLSVASLVVPIGVAVATCVCAATLKLHRPAEDAVPAFETGVMLHGLAAVIELCGEPFYILATVNLQFQLRVVMDTLPLCAKSLTTLACVSGWAGHTAATLPPRSFSPSPSSHSRVSCVAATGSQG